MKIRDKFIVFILCLITFVIYVIVGSYNNIASEASKNYRIYLDGNLIGVIKDKDELYDLIDEKQQDIKKKFNVSNVYPPIGLEVVENYSYNDNINDILDVYNRIEELQDFTISGYEIQVSKGEEHDPYNIYVLDKEVFNEALKKFIFAFISEDEYNNYINGTQGNLEETLFNYDDMGIVEDIVISEKNISANAKIYEDSDELAKDILFGFNHKEESYTVKKGDTIESISDDHKLNPQEFLIANPRFSSKDSLLAIGDKVNVTLINPELSFTYKVSEIKEVEQSYNKEVVRDNSKPSSYSEITQIGVKGITLQYQTYNVTNGEQSDTMEIVASKVIREPVDEITTKGKKAVVIPNYGSSVDTYVDTGTGWRWPTIRPSTVTSEFKWRWGRQHNGIDIYAAKFSNIYAANDGVVVEAVSNCPNEGSYPNSCGGGYGNHVYIDHGNNIYTVYAHMTNNIKVTKGQVVKRGQVVGYLGMSGQVKGYHLHFGLSIGYPHQGTFKNPRELFQ